MARLAVAMLAVTLSAPCLADDITDSFSSLDALAAPSFSPPACSSQPYSDVLTGDLFCPWIQQLAADGMTLGCGGGNYCPKNAVTREQLAMLLEKAMRGTEKWTHAESFFGQFGGNGQDGVRSVAGIEPVGATRRQYTTLTVPLGQTLYVDHLFAYIAVKGRCTVAGTIDVAGRGAQGGTSSDVDGTTGFNGIGDIENKSRVPYCIAGAGGGGGSPDLLGIGGYGGGASTNGTSPTVPGFPPSPATPLPSDLYRAMTGGATGLGAGDTLREDFGRLLECMGGGGGSGGGTSDESPGADGGRGGGVLYLECGEFEFSGVLDGRGNPGIVSDGVNGAGGGGGGGVILVRTRKIVAPNSGLVSVLGGAGGGGAYPGSDGVAGYWDVVVVP